MTEDFAPIGDMITLVANDQHAEATPLVHDLLGSRIALALQDHKQTIARSLFAPSTEALAEEKHDDEVEDTKLVKKLVKRECLAKEESEQLDELSKATLGSYIQSRTHDLRSSGAASGARGQWPKETKDRAEAISVAKKEGDKIQAGIKLAAKKLSKEESEQLDEISKATAYRVGEKRYKKGSATQAASMRSEDPLTKKVLGNQAVKLFTKSTKAFEYAKKKEK